MAEKKKQPDDARDIFETALDYSLPVGGAIGGAVLLRGRGRYAKELRKFADNRFKQATEAAKRGDDDAFEALEASGAHFSRLAGNADLARVGKTIVGGVGGAGLGAAGAGIAYDMGQRNRRRKKK